MTVPADYYDASRHFEEFLVRARDAAGLTTTNQSFTMVEGVFRAFRRRLSIEDAIRFAAVLPPIACALFVADWDPEESRRPFEDRAAMTREAQSLRGGHNFAPDTCIHDVAVALRGGVDGAALDAVLARLPDAARVFWVVDASARLPPSFGNRYDARDAASGAASRSAMSEPRFAAPEEGAS